MTFKDDRLENEKNDPTEASSLKFVNVPIVLIALFLGFGVTYLAMKTPNTAMTPGDSRTLPTKNADQSTIAVAAGNDLEKMMEVGKQVFAKTCQACHQPTGMGIPGAFPPLAGSEWVTGSGKKVAAIILHGLQGEVTVKGEKYNSVMPPFKDQLKSDEVAAVGTFIRNSFGNKSDLVSIEDVEAVKEKTKDRNSAWNGENELKAQGF